jgi:hypothetical protein
MKITGKIRIKNGDIKYLDRFLELLKSLKANPENEGKAGYIIVDMEEMSIKDSQRGYYFGILLPEIAEKAFERDIDKAHIEMKRRFAWNRIHAIEEIPTRQKERAILEYELVQDGKVKGIFRAMWYPGFSEPKVHVAIKLYLRGWMQSMSTMTIKDAAKFIKLVEVWAIRDLGISIKSDAPAIRTDAVRPKAQSNETTR